MLRLISVLLIPFSCHRDFLLHSCLSLSLMRLRIYPTPRLRNQPKPLLMAYLIHMNCLHMMGYPNHMTCLHSVSLLPKVNHKICLQSLLPKDQLNPITCLHRKSLLPMDYPIRINFPHTASLPPIGYLKSITCLNSASLLRPRDNHKMSLIRPATLIVVYTIASLLQTTHTIVWINATRNARRLASSSATK